MMRHVRVVVVAPLRAELPAGLARRADVELRAVGLRSAWPAEGPLPGGQAAVLITGTCGDLAGATTMGSLVAPDVVLGRCGEILRPNSLLRTGLLEAAQRLRLPVEAGLLAESDAVVDGAAARRQLQLASGASFVDMESASLAALAGSRGAPWAILRIVSDTPAQPLDWLADLLGGLPDSQPTRRRVAVALVRRPWHVMRLARLARGMRRGTGAVGRIVEDWLGRP